MGRRKRGDDVAFCGFSEKQLEIMSFPYTSYDALICDGAIRSGKTSIMFVTFVDWAMREFKSQRFAVCGKTISSARQNVIVPYMSMDYANDSYQIKWHGRDNILEISNGENVNIFEVFGGRDESSYMLIQGRTLAGVFLDEVALMPRSFVEQSLARCSVEGSLFWFNCNPDGPSHWFKREWIDHASEHNALHLHFMMSDNPSLSDRMLRRYESMYTGVFYKRYIEGLWVQAEGIIYPMYEQAIERPYQGKVRQYVVSCDYGTQNAFAALMWGYGEDKAWHLLKEYRYSGRDEGHQKTDMDYLADMIAFCESEGLSRVEFIIDPSAASFYAALRKTLRFDFNVRKAKNDVEDGIRDTAVCMQSGLIKISEDCEETIRELGGYVWDDNANGRDKPLKVNDHCMDAMRYFVETKRVYSPKSEYSPIF